MNLGLAPRALIAAGAAAVAVAICTPATAGAAARPPLLQRYQPVTVMDAAEQFAPTAIGSFVAGAVLEAQTAPGAWQIADATPTPGSLPAHPTSACAAADLHPCYRLNEPACSPAAGPAGLGCYRDAWLAAAPRSVVYGRAVRRGRTTVLQYWYFTYDDLYSYNYPPDDLFWQAHEGDWEMVSVLVRGGHAVAVGYSQHCTGERRAWDGVERWHGTTHPVVYVANGSHANLFAAGEHPIAQQCIPPQAIQLLQQAGLPMPTDHAHPGATVYGPGGLAGVTPTRVVRVSGRSPGWIRFEGTWGEVQVFHAPPPIGTVVSGLSPVSPPQTDSWRHPLRTLLGWPLAP